MSKIPLWAEIQSTILDGTPLDELPPLERLVYNNEPDGVDAAKEFRDDLQALVDEYEERIAELTEWKRLAERFMDPVEWSIFHEQESQGDTG